MNSFFQIAGYPLADMAGRPPTKQAPRFGQRLAVLRKQQGLSQEALARLLDTTRDNIAYYERKAENPSLDFIERCAQALHVSPEELIAGSAKARSTKPGPPARWEQLSRRLATLPRGRQRVVIDMLEGLLDKTGTANGNS
jgi:transcriptional regulator with XRE-family HTH domain